ncbi:MAG: hypothetical protein AB7S38_15200 [Vulcanimicrobiota bacterium]
MFTWLSRKMIRKFEARYGYDAAYLHDILQTGGPGALLRVALVQSMGAYDRDVPRDALFAARLAAIVAEDCGPCAQLTVRMAEEAGVPGTILAAVVAGDDEALPAEVRLAVEFVRHALARDPEADQLRQEVITRFGPRAPLTLAYALTTARIYPTLKYALGHGHVCMRVEVEGVAVARPAALVS